MKLRTHRLSSPNAKSNKRQTPLGNTKKPIRHHLIQHITHLRFRNTAKHAISSHSLRMPHRKILRLRTTQNLNDLADTNLLLHIMHAHTDGTSHISHINSLESPPAISAPAIAYAGIRIRALAEIACHIGVQAFGWYGSSRPCRRADGVSRRAPPPVLQG